MALLYRSDAAISTKRLSKTVFPTPRKPVASKL
jgi:hypothetical protein